jgi:hypothetical protein
MSTGYELDLSGTSGAGDLNVGYESVKEGVFHVGVTDVEMSPQNANHEYIANAFLKLTMEIFAGDPATETGKKFSTIFFRPDPSASEKWKFENARNLLGRLGMATLVIPAGSYGKQVAPEWEKMVGRHFVIEMRPKAKKTDDGKEGFLNPRNIWHVASPDVARYVNADVVAEFPMGADTLPLSAAAANGSGSANGNGGQPGGQPSPGQSSAGASPQSAMEGL